MENNKTLRHIEKTFKNIEKTLKALKNIGFKKSTQKTFQKHWLLRKKSKIS